MGMSFMIFGRRGAGKDTVAELLKHKLTIEQLALSKYVHNACHAFGIDNPTKTDLVFIGTEIGRKQINDKVWINMGIKEVMSNPDTDYIISDVRFHDEYESFFEMNFFPIWIDCEFDTCVERVIKRDGSVDMSLFNHQTENNYKEFIGYRIDNNGSIDDLEEQIDKLLIELQDETKFKTYMEYVEMLYMSGVVHE